MESERMTPTLFFVSGIITLIQTFVGDRMPAVQGGAFAYVQPVVAVTCSCFGRRAPRAAPRGARAADDDGPPPGFATTTTRRPSKPRTPADQGPTKRHPPRQQRTVSERWVCVYVLDSRGQPPTPKTCGHSHSQSLGVAFTRCRRHHHHHLFSTASAAAPTAPP